LRVSGTSEFLIEPHISPSEYLISLYAILLVPQKSLITKPNN